MKQLFILFVTLMFTACNDNKNADTGTTDTKEESKVDNVSSPGQNAITFVVNGNKVVTKVLSAGTNTIGTMQIMTVVSDKEVSPQTINISINGTKPGSYTFSDGIKGMQNEGLCFGSYTPDAKNDMLNVYSFVDGTLTLTSVDNNANKLEATFSGSVQNAKQDVIKITEGRISKQ